MDIAGHAYFGAYLLIKVLIAPFSFFASFFIAALLAKASNKQKMQESQVNVMFLYIFFTVVMLFIVNVLKPEILDSLVFGNVFSGNWINLFILSVECMIYFYISYTFLKIIVLDVISGELVKGIYGTITVNKWIDIYLFFSFLILFHAITYFGVLLTAAIAILPYYATMQFKKGLQWSVLFTLTLSTMEYVIAFYMSMLYDVSLAVIYGVTALVPIILIKIVYAVKQH